VQAEGALERASNSTAKNTSNFLDEDLKPAMKAYAKQKAFVWWQETFARKPVLSQALDDLAYDTLGELGWYDDKYCDPATWCVRDDETDRDSEGPAMVDRVIKSAHETRPKLEECSQDTRETSSSESELGGSSVSPSKDLQEDEVESLTAESDESLVSISEMSGTKWSQSHEGPGS
jgi:hypothetical protein